MSSITIDTKEVDRLVKVLGSNRDAIVRMMAFEVEGEFKMRCAVETHAMQNSCYVETSKGGGFGAVDSKVKGSNSKAVTIPHPTPEEGFANVGPSVDYASAVEFPGRKRKWAGHPALVPAMESVAQKYNSGDKWKQLTK